MENYRSFKKVDPCLLSTPKKGLRVTMSIGVSCPLKCKHCYQEGIAKFSADLKTNLISLIQMSESEVSKLYWDGAEPMTNPDIEKYLETIRDLKSRPNSPSYLFERVSIATNGILVSEARAKRIYDRGLKDIMVSLDGASSSTHDHFRNMGSFDKAIDSIKTLKEVGYNVRVGTTIWRRNVHELEDIIKRCIELSVDEIAFNWLQPVGNALKHPELLIEDYYYQYISRKIEGLTERYEEDIKLSFHRGGKADAESICKAGATIAYVSGEWVWPCSWIGTVAPEFKSALSLKENTLTEILRKDPKIKEFRELVASISKEGGCCPAIKKIYTGSFNGPDPISKGGVHITNQRELK